MPAPVSSRKREIPAASAGDDSAASGPKRRVRFVPGDKISFMTPQGRVWLTTPDPATLLAGLSPKTPARTDRKAPPASAPPVSALPASSPPAVLSPMVPILEFRAIVADMRRPPDPKATTDSVEDAAEVSGASKDLRTALKELCQCLPSLGELTESLAMDHSRERTERSYLDLNHRLQSLNVTLDGLEHLADQLETHEVKAGSEDDTRAELVQAFFADLTPILSDIAPRVAQFVEAEHPKRMGERKGLSEKLQLFCDWADNSQKLIQDPGFKEKIEELGEKPRSTFMRIIFLMMVTVGCVFLLLAFLDKIMGDDTLVGRLSAAYVSFAKTLIDTEYYKKSMNDAKLETMSKILGDVVAIAG